MTRDENIMDCKTFQQNLEAHAGGTMSAAERLEVDRHLAGCARCQELDALVRGDLDVAPIAPPVDLTAAILERTSGSACQRARELLCDYVDESLERFQAGLVRQHTADCSGCHQVEVTLQHLSADLPAMALLSPDATFVADVLATTRRAPDRWGQRLAAFGDSWQRLLQRPRFGLEASYVGAIAMWALFGLSASPFSDVPQQALAALQAGPVVGVEKATSAVGQIQTQIGQASKLTWKASAEQGAETLDLLAGGVRRSLQRTANSREALRLHGSQLGGAALRLNVEQSAKAARNIGKGLGSLWHDIHASNTHDRTHPPATAPSDDC